MSEMHTYELVGELTKLDAYYEPDIAIVRDDRGSLWALVELPHLFGQPTDAESTPEPPSAPDLFDEASS